MKKNYRTDKQNKYYFKCIVIPLGKFLGYHKYEMHEELKRLFIEDTSKELNTVDLTTIVNRYVYGLIMNLISS